MYSYYKLAKKYIYNKQNSIKFKQVYSNYYYITKVSCSIFSN